MPRATKGADPSERSITRARPTLLGCWLLVSLALTFTRWRTLGVWTIVTLGYLAGVFFVSLVSARYLAPAWIIFLPMLVLPLDIALSALLRRRKA
jgi:hypothetical protein